MASESSIAAVEMLLKINNALVAAQESAQLSYSENLLELLKKESGLFGETMQGEREWNLSSDIIYQSDAGANLVGADGVVSLDVTYGGSTETVPGLDSLEATFSTEFDDSAGLDDPLWRHLAIVGKAMELNLSGDYYDPASAAGAAYGLLLDAQEAGDVVGFTLHFGVLEFSGDVRPGDWTLDLGSRGENSGMDFTLQHDGVITKDAGTVDTGQEALVQAWFDGALVSARVEHQEDGSEVEGSTYYEGDGYIETLNLTAERAEDLGLDVDIAGDGALTRDTIAAT